MKKDKLILLIIWLLVIHPSKAQEKELPSMYETGSFFITVFPEIQQEKSRDILIGATDDMLKQHITEGTFSIAVNAFMVETPDHTALVDAGSGQKLFNHLETCGKKAEDIDIILLTHLHGDHTGGLLRDGEKSFPAAKLYVSRPEYDYWMSEEIISDLPENRQKSFTGARKVLNAYKENLHVFIPEEAGNTGDELLPGIRGIAAYGHTPGHTAYLLHSEHERLLIWGDIAHAMDIQIPYPQVAVTYDVNPAQAIESRQKLLKYVSDNKIRIAGMHIEYPGMGDIRGDSLKGYDFTLLCTCEGTFR
ncbi:MAG: MBL fold metallo-hydrolase [Tannerella sp.]|jgi:glyoxylase-like metal-dependent hydrolase (beta-lactamase superfamily II)|nr:MBL fold metallo-hydrolase [Tannerella sp.]